LTTWSRPISRALRRSDAEGIRIAFHPQAQILGAPDRREHFTWRRDFEDFVSEQPAPDEVGEPHDMSYRVLDQTTTSALVRARVLYQGIVCIDYLTLARFESGWRIVNKMFHREDTLA
jgi:hypothetical protein